MPVSGHKSGVSYRPARLSIGVKSVRPRLEKLNSRNPMEEARSL
jgi:hypothetical protein